MKLLRSSKAYVNFLLTISEWVASDNALSYLIAIILALGSVFSAFMLISRVNAYNNDPFEENFTEAKNMKKIAAWVNRFMSLWIFLSFINMLYNFQFGKVRIVFFIIGIIGYVLSWYSLKKFHDANRNHNIALAKANRGDPSIVMAENFGLTQAQKDAVSMIVGNAGASSALRDPMSDEELFGPIDDPVYDDPHTPRIVCRACGKVNNPKYDICVYCGAVLDKTKKAVPAEFQSEIDKILNGTKDEDPVQRILRNAGVIQTEGGKYVSVKKAAENDINSEDKENAVNPENKVNDINDIKVTPTTDIKEDKSITVAPLTESIIIDPTPIDDSVKVTELKGTDFYSNEE
ncbi:MAG: hypothetical protein K2K41_08815 [Ruminiclostridium sp.]|nr:hypothetical protein [Ruminiclostridium sp.]